MWIPALFAVTVVAFVLVTGCLATQGSAGTAVPASRERAIDWRTTSLHDVSTGANFTIEDFQGVPVLIQAFTVWCPICTSQQHEVMRLRDEGVDFRFVALDIDPNEDESLVRDHLARNNLSGSYAVAPIEATASLVREFGSDMITPSSAPVVLVCPGGLASKLPAGVKAVASLKRAISGC